MKTANGEVKFDTAVKGWERLVARIRAELAERKPVAANTVLKQTKAAPERPDLARLAPWLETLPRTLRYPRSSYHKVVLTWVVFLVGLLLCGLMGRVGLALVPSYILMWVMIVFSGLFGTGYGPRYARRRAENACVTVTDDSLVVVGVEGVEHQFAWEEVLHVQEVPRKFNIYEGLSKQARWVPARRAIQVRTPWGYFEIDRGLEEYDRLLELLQRIVAERETPPDYPAARMVASDAALSQAQPSTEPTPTETSLSQAKEPAEEKSHLAAPVSEAESEPAEVKVHEER